MTTQLSTRLDAISDGGDPSTVWEQHEQPLKLLTILEQNLSKIRMTLGGFLMREKKLT